MRTPNLPPDPHHNDHPPQARRRSNLSTRQAAATSFPLAGFLLLCCSCSFNNSFQEGCIGSIRLEVPQNDQKSHPSVQKSTQEQQHLPTQKNAQERPLPPPQAHPEKPQHVFAETKEATPQSAVVVAKERRPRQDIYWFDLPKRPLHKAISQGESETKTVEGEAEKIAILGASSTSYPSALQSVLRAEAALQRLNPWRQASQIHLLRVALPEAIWKERPSTISVCYDPSHKNSGWARYHDALHTASIERRCQAGKPLGKNTHWHVLSDTFAASDTACRLFFSPGRLAVIAECGETLYRAPIQPSAPCLQQRKGCTIPQITLARLEREATQAVEIPHHPR